MDAKDLLVLSRVGLAWWDDDPPTRHQFLAFGRGEAGHRAIAMPLDQLIAPGRDDAIRDRNDLTALHAQNAKFFLARHFHEMPIGRNPCRRDLFALDGQLSPRRIELVFLFRAGAFQRPTAAARNARREQLDAAVAHPEPVVRETDDDVRPGRIHNAELTRCAD